MMWEKYKGKIVPGMVLHHKCGNRRCANPEHLEMVTRVQHLDFHREDMIREHKARLGIQKSLAAFGDPGWSFPELRAAVPQLE